MGRLISTKEVPSLAARLLLQRPERVAEAWQCARYAEEGDGAPEHMLGGVLEGVVVSFIREIGAQLAGTPGSAWERASGVLKLCEREGTGPIYRELATLRRVLDSALDALKATLEERLMANGAIDDALTSAVLAYEHLRHPERPAANLHFGGVVVERFAPNGRRTWTDGEESELEMGEVEWEERAAS